ncbi:MAG: hypothetical protein F6K30_01180, partial [Cyanothece sp. SIO2G6]|nr:hypothetical protein [Cyanothece sp. SIO2G6]
SPTRPRAVGTVLKFTPLAPLGTALSAASGILSAVQAAYNGDWAGAIFQTGMTVLSYGISTVSAKRDIAKQALSVATSTDDIAAAQATFNSLTTTLNGLNTARIVADTAYTGYKAFESGDTTLALLYAVKGVADVIGENFEIKTIPGNLLLTAGQVSVTAYKGIKAIENGELLDVGKTILEIGKTLNENFFKNDNLKTHYGNNSGNGTSISGSQSIFQDIFAFGQGIATDTEDFLQDNFGITFEDIGDLYKNGKKVYDTVDSLIGAYKKGGLDAWLKSLDDILKLWKTDIKGAIDGVIYDTEILEIAKELEISPKNIEIDGNGDIYFKGSDFYILIQSANETSGDPETPELTYHPDILRLAGQLDISPEFFELRDNGDIYFVPDEDTSILAGFTQGKQVAEGLEQLSISAREQALNALDALDDGLKENVVDYLRNKYVTPDNLRNVYSQELLEENDSWPVSEIHSLQNLQEAIFSEEQDKKDTTLRQLEERIGIESGSLTDFRIGLVPDQDYPILVAKDQHDNAHAFLTDGDTFIALDSSGYAITKSGVRSVIGRIQEIDKDREVTQTNSDLFDKIGGFFVQASEQVEGFLTGFTEAGVETVEGVYNLGQGLWYLSGGWVTNREKAQETWDSLQATGKAIITDPSLLFDAIVDPYVTAWEEKRYGAAIGRGTFELLTSLVGTKGLDKFAVGVKAGDKISDLGEVISLASRTQKAVKYTPNELGQLYHHLGDIELNKLWQKGEPLNLENFSVRLESQHQKIVSSFRSGTYSAIELNEPVTLYRVISQYGNPYGSYWSMTPPKGSLASKIEGAIDHSFGNNAAYVQTIEVPKGQVIYEGFAAEQKRFTFEDRLMGNFIGGGHQVYIPDVPAQWAKGSMQSINDFTKNIDPIILDLNNNGVDLISLDQSSVAFDMDNDGVSDRTGWLSPEDGFLAHDRNGDGQINNITELFSEYHSPGAHTGLQALATLDSNSDQQIDIQDAAFTELSVWRDRNTNGNTDPGELMPIEESGISAIALNHTPVNENRAGNIVLSTTQAQFTDGSSIEVAEVAFLVNSGTSVDLLTGGRSDRNLLLQGGSETDTFHLGTPTGGNDAVMSMIQNLDGSESDRLLFPTSSFSVDLILGEWCESQFVLGSAATRKSDRLTYNNATGASYCDADGSGSGYQTQIAHLITQLTWPNMS